MGDTLKAGSVPDFRRFESKRDTDGSADSDAQSVRTMPQIPENQTDLVSPAQQSRENGKSKLGPGGGAVVRRERSNTEGNFQTPQKDTTLEPGAQPPASPQAIQRSSTSSGWFGGWFGSPAAPQKPVAQEDKQMSDLPEESESNPTKAIEEPQAEAPAETPQTPKTLRPARSWLGSWWSTPATPESTRTATDEPARAPPLNAPLAQENEDVTMEDAPPTTPAPAESQPSAGSTWAFWSRDTGSKITEKSKLPEQGELAVMGEGSEASPRRSSGVQVKDGPSSPVKESPLKKEVNESPKKAAAARKNKRNKPGSIDLDDATPSRPTTLSIASASPTPSTAKTSPPNLLLPSFRMTYQMKQNPSIIKQIAQLLLRTQQPPANHVHLVKEPPKIKKAIAIGVHGLFPAAYLRPMVGQPTGTSIRFANHCAEAIRRWADSHGCQDCEIEKVALEGEGKIAERVDNLWKLLLNWIEHIRGADLILLACHSQGVPVGLMLVAKLIDLGIITTARIGICAMAGVSLGPFPDYKSGMGMLMGSAAELWHFGEPASDVSQRLEHAAKVALEHGARVTYIGSIDDQLVPMESAVYSPASHPYIYRAVFVDGRIHAPDFIAHLVGFALKLRNLGISDQGLIRELSVALAGSLYSGEGHSRLYDDDQVYE
jgi:hypothetical protein